MIGRIIQKRSRLRLAVKRAICDRAGYNARAEQETKKGGRVSAAALLYPVLNDPGNPDSFARATATPKTDGDQPADSQDEQRDAAGLGNHQEPV